MSTLNTYLEHPGILKLIKKMEEFFKSLPHLPKNWVEGLVRITPYIILIWGIFSALGVLNALGMARGTNFMSDFVLELTGIPRYYFILSAVISLIIAVLCFMAFNPLKEKKMIGWLHLFWLELIQVISIILSVIFVGTGFAVPVVASLVGFYLIFEIKGDYK